MIGSGSKRWFIAVLIGIVLGIGGLAGQPAAQAAAAGPSSEGGYEAYGGCPDCYDDERQPCGQGGRCDDRRDRPAGCRNCSQGNGPCEYRPAEPPPCGNCNARQPRCGGDCYDRQPRPRCGGDCYDRQPQPRCGGDCSDRQPQPRCGGDCYDRQPQPRCGGDCYDRPQSGCSDCYDERRP